jgi:hypothetical protein
MREYFFCKSCGQVCMLESILHPTRGKGLAFERDEQRCKVKNAPKGEGQQGGLIAFALEDPQAQKCAYWQRLAEGCGELRPQ